MNRDDAITFLAEYELTLLPLKERESLLLGWWDIDEDDAEYATLPEEIKEEMAASDAPADPANPKFDPLLRLALRANFHGVINSYLESRLRGMGIKGQSVTGLVEPMHKCPCCGYFSLERRGWDICGVCFWEDDGDIEPSVISGPNHMTLEQGRANFAKYGAVEERFKDTVLLDGKEP